METTAERVLMKGNEAIAEAAIRAGVRAYFGYPITPQSEIAEYMARELPRRGGVFLQAESEVAAINMVYGAAGAGARVMTSTSSPGISLMQEGLSYLVGSELPCVIINVMRGGPGLGNIAPSQADYFQATKSAGHGDGRNLVLAPATIQEAADLTALAFELADRYRNPVMVLTDGITGQMMEPVTFRADTPPAREPPPWATTGAGEGPVRLINSIYLEPEALEHHNRRLVEKYRRMQSEVRYEAYRMEDATVAVAAYGLVARIARTAVDRARARGLRVGLLRPITVYPFPSAAFAEAAGRVAAILTVEMSAGQMVEDVRLAVAGRTPVRFYGRLGGAIPTPPELVAQIEALAAEVSAR
ncbi:MAG: 3-methyl-2-oxobutanoate dehydrogenase subunit VorB [Armatimonadota bacterium]|nr:3-methyl-2-oxobutanoate dehydrogenase subunit VorB [Armatimonadota bacterium]MDR7451561.1 3-methyl-2-oxobutanoate dehydrogenase subunit VorB [Armatimonadota bacterium]MDR7467528.1 3-methyl-2-oxobutanoate dehydrogenase subunit VorB [Armatimonadota bacterium]MDR7494402.1 3-methyl-2-oxobutanoate dehydrogenase subunit VorB [Armatimonadota bacterium]MDR7499219.1 3-methyl-2-oxobutanoate dehydrogenase subunit VorB [Armatimonadota bacterium]